MQAMRDRALAEVDALRGDVGRARAAAEAAGLPRALTQPPASSRPPGSLDTNVAAGRTAADVAASARAFDAERELVALTGAYEDLQARYARVGADLSEERARSRELAGGLQTAESRAREAAESLARCGPGRRFTARSFLCVQHLCERGRPGPRDEAKRWTT